MKILLPAKLNSTGTILIMEDTTQNTCRYCGKSLPEEAIFAITAAASSLPDLNALQAKLLHSVSNPG